MMTTRMLIASKEIVLLYRPRTRVDATFPWLKQLVLGNKILKKPQCVNMVVLVY